jgi:hypothetical protein
MICQILERSTDSANAGNEYREARMYGYDPTIIACSNGTEAIHRYGTRSTSYATTLTRSKLLKCIDKQSKAVELSRK